MREQKRKARRIVKTFGMKQKTKEQRIRNKKKIRDRCCRNERKE